MLALTSANAEILADSLLFSPFKKEIISSEHIRYEIDQSNQLYNGLIFNLQIKEFSSDDLWIEANYEEEVQFALKTRRFIAFFLGLSNYTIISHHYKLRSPLSPLPIQIINGSYLQVENEITYFKEINLYQDNKLYQFKFYFKAPLTDDDSLIESILNQFQAQLKMSEL